MICWNIYISICGVYFFTDKGSIKGVYRRHSRHGRDETQHDKRLEARRQAQAQPHRRREPRQGQHEGPPPHEVAQRAEEEQARGVAGLHDGGDDGGALVADAEGVGQHAEDGVGVVEVCDLQYILA